MMEHAPCRGWSNVLTGGKGVSKDEVRAMFDDAKAKREASAPKAVDHNNALKP
jgi:hypothetical protein